MPDELDLRLIRELEEGGLRTQAELGRRLGASEATIRRREHRLQEKRALKICGIPNLNALGYDLVACLGLSVDFEHRPAILSSLTDEADVRYVASCTGRYELLVCVACRSRQELSVFMEKLTSTPGVLHIETFVNLSVYKNRPWLIDNPPVQP
ncbi:MAG: Lrp/AsnC family transcriptional regulator [Dehalococcoidia bacterium]|nr:MAG: Lrp/AsnC family transcriptional regulator [Dehalococcoidia bacterium]